MRGGCGSVLALPGAYGRGLSGPAALFWAGSFIFWLVWAVAATRGKPEGPFLLPRSRQNEARLSQVESRTGESKSPLSLWGDVT